MKFKKLKFLFLFPIVFVVLLGCGKKSKDAESSLEDISPFRVAIEEYLKSKNYGMDIASFDELCVKGNAATATCKMSEAENLYAIRVSWEFVFEKDTANNKWKVVKHSTR